MHAHSSPVHVAAVEYREQVYPSLPEITGTTARVLEAASVAPSLSASTPLSSSGTTIQALLQRIKKLEDSNSIASSRHATSADSVDRGVHSIVEPHEPELDKEDSVVRHAKFTRGHDTESRDWQDIVKNKTRNLGRTRRMGGAPEFAAIIECYSVMLGKTSKDDFSHEPEIKELLVEGGELLVESKHIARRLKGGRRSMLAHSLSIAPNVTPRLGQYLVPPSRERADAMTKLYFESFESTYRILHVPTFWDDYEKYWQAPGSVTNAVYLQILLVVAIGSSLYNHGDSNAVLGNIEMSRPCIYAAENWLAGPLEKERLDIGGFQIYCLCIVARQIFSIGGDLVWISMGSLLHRAMQCGLHREPRHLPGVSMFNAELRRRLWATILDMVVQASLDASMPPRISLDEFDIEPPSNINDEEMNESTTIIVPHPRTTFTSTSVQLSLLDTLPVRLGIVQYLNGLHSEQSYSSVLSLSSQLTSALRMCESLGMMKARPQNQAHNIDKEANTTITFTSITPFQQNLLNYLVRRFMIPLHMFFATQTRSNPTFHYSLTVSLDAALAIVSSATPTPEFSFGNDNDTILFDRLLSMAGGLYREGFRAALTAITLELLVHVTTQQESGTLHRAPQHRELLKTVVRDLVVLAERRVRHGDTNIKGYMFLNMVLAQVEAVEAGAYSGDRAFKMALAKGAVKSLRFCRDEIKGRANAMIELVDGEDMEFDADGMDLARSMDSDPLGMDWNWEAFLTTGHLNGADG